jgi:hypothetical protein
MGCYSALALSIAVGVTRGDHAQFAGLGQSQRVKRSLMSPDPEKRPPARTRSTVRGTRLRTAVFLFLFVILSCETAFAAAPRVILLRGWFGIFSTGLDTIADQLKAMGIDAEVAGHLAWSNEVTKILQERAAGRVDPLALVGHSQGANNIIDMARELAPHGVKVDLLVTLAPMRQNPVPPNVVKAVNFYPPVWGSALVADPAFHGELHNINLVDDPDVSHISIDKDPKIQAAVIREIVALRSN